MPGQRIDRPNLRGAVACCVLAVVALSLDASGEATVRACLNDAAWPGLALRQSFGSLVAPLDFSRWPWTTNSSQTLSAAVNDPEAELLAKDEELRRLRLALAESRREVALLSRSLGPVRVGEAPRNVERISARVLKKDGGSLAPGGLLLDGGRSEGIESGRIAVQSACLAAGDTAVSEGDIVLAGAAVVGRTDVVGAWTSSVLPVTDERYRAHVWIVRETNSGPAFGEQGILEGVGNDRCVLKYVPSTASVAVGDHVYSRDPTGRLSQPLYYGQVVKAQLRDGAPHWDILVRPAASAVSLDNVHVITPPFDEVPAPSKR